MKHWTIILTLGLLAFPVMAIARSQSPQGPTGVAVCQAGANTDSDGDNLTEVSDPSCATANGFTSAGGGFAAQAESFVLSGAWATVSDTSANGGSYARVPVGADPFAGEMATGGISTPGTYYVWALVNIPTSSSAVIWIKSGLTPFLGAPTNEEAAALNNDMPTGGWQWIALGRLDKADNWRKAPKLNETPRRTLTVASGDQIHIMAAPGLRIDCIFLHTSPTASAVCPGGGSTGVTEDYLIRELGANSVTVNGTEEGFWPQADQVIMTGTASPTAPTGTWVTRMAWSDPLNRLYFITKTTVANLAATTNTANDQSLVGTRVEMIFRFVDLTKVLDSSTYKVACDIGSFVWDANYPSGASDKSYNFTRACTASYGSNQLIIEGFIQPTETLTANTYMLFNGLIQEIVTGSSPAYQYFRGSSNTIGQAGIAKLSSTTMTTADSTPPTMGTLAFPAGNVTQTSLTVTSTSNEPVTCSLRHDRTNDNTIAGATVVPPTGQPGIDCGPSVGNVCTCQVTGLTPATAYEVQITGRDGAGNTGTSNVGDQTTSAAGTVRWLRPDGVDTGACTTQGSPCKTFAYVKTQMAAGNTLTLRNGTYTHGTTGLLEIDGADGWPTGTATQPIRIIAENERGAIHADTVAGRGAKVHTVSYYSVEGIVFTKQSFDSDGSNSYAVNFDGKFCPNLTLKRNLFIGVSGGTSPYLNGTVTIRDDCDNALIEENEFYVSNRELIIAKYNKNGIFRRNYGNSRSTPFASGAGGGFFTIYPGSNWIVENNIGIYPGHGAAFGCSSYSRSSGKACVNNKWFGNIAYQSLGGFNVHTTEPTDISNTDARPLDNLVEHHLVIGDNNQSAGILSKSSENTTVRRSTAMFMGPGKPAFYTATVSAMTGVRTFYGEDLLAVNNLDRPLTIDSSISDWSVNGLHIFNNALTYSAQGTGNCTNCTNIVTTDPSLGNKRVWTGLTKGAEILYSYEGGVLNLAKKLWVSTVPSGWGGTVYPFFFRGCGTVVAGLNDTAGDSCAGFANLIAITSSTLPNGY